MNDIKRLWAYCFCALIIAALGIAMSRPLNAQWATGSRGSIYYNDGKVGINNSTPQESLSVDGGANGDISVGTATNNKVFVGTFQDAGGIAINRRISDGTFTNPNLGTAELSLWSVNGGAYITFGTSSANNIEDAERMRITQTGDVGIGTSSPSAKLDVRGWSQQNSFNTVDSGGIDLQVLSANKRPLDGGIITLGGSAGATGYIKTAAIDGTAGDLILGTRQSATDSGMLARLVIDRWGNVGIGTTSPQHTLSVNGTIQAKEVIVNTGWSDYVFDPAYKLTPLPRVASYIKQHHHLPGVPSEAEVEQNGVPVGQMESTLLAKVEELTLQMIKLHKTNKVLQAKVAQLEKEVQEKKP